jgi:hypothetical protein
MVATDNESHRVHKHSDIFHYTFLHTSLPKPFTKNAAEYDETLYANLQKIKIMLAIQLLNIIRSS